MNQRKFIRRAMGSIATLTLWALLFSALLLSAVNDIYAFFKPEGTVTVSSELSLSPWELACRLDDAGVIQNPLFFYFYTKDEPTLAPGGAVTLRRDMSYRELTAALRQAASEGKN